MHIQMAYLASVGLWNLLHSTDIIASAKPHPHTRGKRENVILKYHICHIFRKLQIKPQRGGNNLVLLEIQLLTDEEGLYETFQFADFLPGLW